MKHVLLVVCTLVLYPTTAHATDLLDFFAGSRHLELAEKAEEALEENSREEETRRIKPFISPIHAILEMEEKEALKKKAQDQKEKEMATKTVEIIIRIQVTDDTDKYVVVPEPWCD